MARIRSIKPEFFVSEDVSALPLRARLTWIGLWTQCDDHGRTKDNAKLVKAAIWPLDDLTLKDVEDDLTVLDDYGRIRRYEVDGKPYLEVTGWARHQKITNPSQPKYPAPPDASHSPHIGLTEAAPTASVGLGLGGEGKGRERKGGDARDAEPPTRCPKHINSPDDAPCRACGDARRTHDAWLRAERAKPTPSAVPGAGEKRCAVEGHEGYVAKNCAGCRAERLAGEGAA